MEKYFFILVCLISPHLHAMDQEHAINFENLDSPIRLGFVGLGDHMTEKLIPALDKEKFELVYGCRRNLTELLEQQKKYGFKYIATNYNDMISSGNIDAVIVAGTPELHREVAEACIRQGLHVFVEKPVSLSLDTVRVLTHLAEENTNIISAVGFNLVHMPAIKKVKQKLRTDELKNLEIYCTLGEPLYLQETFNQTLQNCLYFAFTHSISVLVDLLGKPQDVRVIFKKEKHPNGFALDVTPTYDHERSVRLYFANCCNPGGFVFRISYEDRQGNHLIDITKKDGYKANEKQLSYKNELDFFYDSIKLGKNTKNNFQRNLEIHEILETIKTKVKEQIKS
ncbi:MAG: Gfo/Idh/MocA family oxidoreductase [Candidatus Paracaedibacteraceae bacterium]|nr:Gfo/Idh/MocA family oxidoreductase [Candidatus Paracaedibacteraceae bacterium]